MPLDSRSLLDLPDDLLRSHVYQLLLGYHPGYRSGDLARLQDLRHYRLTCKAFRHLIDSGATSFSCDLAPTLSRTHTTPAGPAWSLLRRAFSPRASTPTVRDLDSSGAFLLRLPRLLSLGLRGWTSEAALVSQLQRLGCATAGHRGPTRLHLTGARLTTSALTAVRRSLPYLRELHVADTAVSAHAEFRLGPYFDPSLDLHPSLFESLQAGQLTKLTYHNPAARARQHVLRGLGGLSHLVHLDLTLKRLHSDDNLHHLSGLVSLAFCSIVCVKPAGEFSDFFAPLLLRSRTLTTLRLHGWFYNLQEFNFAPLAPFAVASLLPGLTRLRSLDLGHAFKADDEVWHHLSRLTQLTMLGVAALRLTAPLAGCLPLLQHLAITCGRGEYDDDYTPLVDLDRSLLPLLPLPSLVRLDITHLCHGHCQLHEGVGEAAALHSLARHLADAPRLHLEGYWHFCACKDYHSYQLTHAQLASAMQPLEGRVAFTETTYTGLMSP